TVDVHRQAFRGAEKRGRRESMVVDVELKRIVRALAHIDAAEIAVQIIRQTEPLLALHLLAIGGLHVRRYLIQRQAEASEGGIADNGDLRKFLGGRWIAG